MAEPSAVRITNPPLLLASIVAYVFAAVLKVIPVGEYDALMFAVEYDLKPWLDCVNCGGR